MAQREAKADKRCSIYYIGLTLGTEDFHSHTSGKITATTLVLTVRLDRQEEEAAKVLHK